LAFQDSIACVAGLDVKADDWVSIVARIRAGDQGAVEQLYRSFQGGVRLLLVRQVGAQELEEHVHDTFLLVLAAIRGGEVRNPACLPAFIRTVMKRRVANHIGGLVRARRDFVDVHTQFALPDGRQSSEERLSLQEQVALMREMLCQLRGQDREILERSYLDGDPVDRICADLRLTHDQFRLRKSRAKSQFAALAKRLLAQRALTSLLAHQRKEQQIA
jgi:RNA polymerase sigma factor (sigma-70 family)